MVLFPCIKEILLRKCINRHSNIVLLPLVAISTHWSTTTFIKGSNPHNIPWTYLPPFNFNNFLSINIFNSGEWALLMMSPQLICVFLAKAFLYRFEMISHCGFGFCFLMDSDVEHLCMYLLASCISSWQKCLFHFFVHF